MEIEKKQSRDGRAQRGQRERGLVDRMVANMPFEPSPSQLELFEKFASFISADASKEWLMLIKGYAGTGKTTALGAIIKLIKSLGMRCILLAPTGRSAKVLSNYTGDKAKTIHRQIYRQKDVDQESVFGYFVLDKNKLSNTVFIVDEVSLINSFSDGTSIFGSGDLMSDLVDYVRQNSPNRLILCGDPAQLPPIGMDSSPALDMGYLQRYCSDVVEIFLKDVLRQSSGSGILVNATALRRQIEEEDMAPPRFNVSDYPDFKSITGEALIETLQDAISEYGAQDVVVLCRSNARANRYNAGIRAKVLYLEERLCPGDRLMVVKNCYRFEGAGGELDFIANGDSAILLKISDYKERYGLNFAQATLQFPDYDNLEIRARIVLDTLDSTSPALSREQQSALYNGVWEDHSGKSRKRDRYKAVKEDPYYNALQIKYATAITGHKSQGGQWKCVFIDNSIWSDDVTIDDKKWLYTAITRGVEMVYLVNFGKQYLE